MRLCEGACALKRRGEKNEQKKESRKRRQSTKKESPLFFDTVIVGAGASGMAAALACGQGGGRILLLDRLEQMGRKLLVTGNGKCNITNLHQEPACYRSETPEQIAPVFRVFSMEDTLAWLRELGIPTREKNGYVYPYSEQASSVREALELSVIAHPSVTFLGGADVTDIEKTAKGYRIRVRFLEEGAKMRFYESDNVILATGGLAGPKFGCDGSGYRLARALGHRIIEPLPALTALKSSAPFLKKVSGVRNQARLTLLVDGQEAASEEGELQWTDYGISGVAVFQVSRFAVLALKEGKNVALSLDFMPGISEEDRGELFRTLRKNNPKRQMQALLHGLFPAKLVPVLLREARIAPEQPAGELDAAAWAALAAVIEHFSLRINGFLGYEKAQVTRGGVPLAELTADLESRRHLGLFFAGEVVDVDGTCGGYNLQWAFSSGTIVGQKAAARKKGRGK